MPYSSYEHTVAELAERLKQLLTDLPTYEREAALARERMHTWFKWEVRGRQLHQVYRNMQEAGPTLHIRTSQPVHAA